MSPRPDGRGGEILTGSANLGCAATCSLFPVPGERAGVRGRRGKDEGGREGLKGAVRGRMKWEGHERRLSSFRLHPSSFASRPSPYPSPRSTRERGPTCLAAGRGADASDDQADHEEDDHGGDADADVGKKLISVSANHVRAGGRVPRTAEMRTKMPKISTPAAARAAPPKAGASGSSAWM